jgi:hypothetical protein
MKNKKSTNLITIKVEGFDSENGHVRADEFVDELARLLTVLNGIDRLVGNTNQPTLYYRIVGVKHSSPLSVTLEPVVKRSVQKPGKDFVASRHHRFFSELNAIRQEKRVSPDMDEQLLENLLDLTGGENQTFKSVTIQNGRSKIKLDKTFEQNLKKMLGEYDASYGGVEGKLDTANIHGYSRRFWIYPTVGSAKIRCDFLPGTSAQIKSALGSYVRVEGIKHFRPQSPYPFRVSVRELTVIDDEKRVSLKDLGGIARGSTQQLSSVEFVRKIRNEWD